MSDGQHPTLRADGGAPAPAAPPVPAHPRILRAYIVAMALIWGGASIAAAVDPLGIARDTAWNWPLLVILTATALVLEHSGTNLFGESRVSISFVPLFVVALLMGPVPAGLAASVAMGMVELIGRRPPEKLIFNTAVVALANMGGGATYHALTQAPMPGEVIWQIGPAILAVLVLFLANTVPVAVVVGLVTNTAPTRVWRERFPWLIPHFAGAGVMAYAMALAYAASGLLGVLVFALPVGLLRLVMQQYTARTTHSVDELKRAYTASRESEERFRSLVQNAPGVVAIFNADGTLRYMSPSEIAADTATRGSVALESIVHAEDLSRVREVLEEARRLPGTHFTVEMRMITRNGAWREFETTFTNLLDHAAVRGVVANARDVTERRALEEQLRHQAFHDPLTGLANRALFMDRLAHALARTQRQSGSVAVMLLDLDRFKLINDSLGHQVGDQLLVAVTERLRGALRSGDTLARFGGDEFTILLEDIIGGVDVRVAVERLLDALRTPFLLEGQESFVTASVGIVMNHGESDKPVDLIRSADIAMYRAKSEGRDRYALYDDALDSMPVERLALETDLRHAVERGQMRVFFQPEVDLHSGAITGLEALVRWEHPERGFLSPGEFIPVAEDTGEIVPIGQWVLREACRFARALSEERPDQPALVLSVNLSAAEFLQADLVWNVARTLRETGLPPAQLRLEITETILLKDTPASQEILKQLQRLGVELAVDDFGTGYSSLEYLRRLPVNVLKIDRSFVADLEHDARVGAIVETVMGLGRALGMAVVAEGIETAEQRALLQQAGCGRGQGYYFARPLPEAAARGFIHTTDAALAGRTLARTAS